MDFVAWWNTSNMYRVGVFACTYLRDSRWQIIDLIVNAFERIHIVSLSVHFCIQGQLFRISDHLNTCIHGTYSIITCNAPRNGHSCNEVLRDTLGIHDLYPSYLEYITVAACISKSDFCCIQSRSSSWIHMPQNTFSKVTKESKMYLGWI